MNDSFILKQMRSGAAESQNSFNIGAYSEKRKVLTSHRARLIRRKAGGLHVLGAGTE
jgi:hypothetical protein